MKASLVLIMVIFSLNCLGQEYYFYDNGVKKPINLKSEYIATSPTASSGSSARGATSSSGAVVFQNAKIQISRVTSVGGSTTGARSSNNSSTDTENAMPVFEINGALTAIVGGIILNFKQGTSPEQVNSFISDNSLNVLKTISTGGVKFFYIESPASIETLSLCNTYMENSIVEEAKPNFWKNVKSRRLPGLKHKPNPKMR